MHELIGGFHSLVLQLYSIPPVFKRKSHVLILLQNAQGKYVFGSKKHYPKGIVRMVGGGLENDEAAQNGAARELKEETGLSVPPTELIPLGVVAADLTGPDDQMWEFETFLFFYNVGNQKPAPSDDLNGLVELTENQFKELIENFSHLSTELHPEMQFRWSDYGKVYGEIHRIALMEHGKIK